MNVSLMETAFRKSLDGTFFSSRLCKMHIKVVYKHISALFTAVTKEMLCHCCSISTTYFYLFDLGFVLKINHKRKVVLL